MAFLLNYWEFKNEKPIHKSPRPIKPMPTWEMKGINEDISLAVILPTGIIVASNNIKQKRQIQTPKIRNWKWLAENNTIELIMLLRVPIPK
jgi:hypothetical protein